MTTDDHEVSTVMSKLAARMRVGQGLSYPYARKWEIGGCVPQRLLWTYPYDALATLSAGLVALHEPLLWSKDAVQVGDGPQALWVGINRSIRGQGPPDAYLLGRATNEAPIYVGNSPEVVLEMISAWSKTVQDLAERDDLQVGFPGIAERLPRYVGSWQWNVHGEASDGEVINRAAAATVAAITKASE